MNKFILVCCLLGTAFFSVYAQDDSRQSSPQMVIIYLEDKSEINGELISENDASIVIRSESLGLLTFQKNEIRRIIRLDPKGRIPNPNPTRYFIGQSAYTLPKGEGYYQNIYGVFNLVSYGVTDRLSLTGGLELISTFSGNPLLFANAKYGVPVAPKLNVAASVSYLTIASSIADVSLGTINGLVTYGTHEHQLTIGTGYAFAQGEIDNSGVITVAGITRLTGRLALITENYLLPGESSIISGGLRYIAKKVTVDLLYFEGGFPAIDIVLKL